MSIDPKDVTACLVTRGNVDMQPIVDSLLFGHTIVWNNAERPWNAKAYGRFLAAEEASTDVVWFQDDDCIIPAEAQQAMCDLYDPDVVWTNMEAFRNTGEFADLCWLGWGTITHRDRYREAHALWADAGHNLEANGFLSTGCDITFSILNPDTRREPFGVQHLPYAHDDDRLYRSDGYDKWKRDIYNAAVELRDRVAA